ncbi:3-hydroxy-3-methylglutaryl CoA synthase [Rhodobacterales bacterium HKCCE2091]|nr:3-hydroxy-3-methylglutaryl CoA synthase [Rhodobacterales bacterium HKCCE2091]
MTNGILRYGAYIPVARLQRSAIHAANKWFAPGLGGLAKGERSMASWDEDAITMGVEAARDALGPADRSGIRALYLASNTMPFAERQNAVIAKEALNLSDEMMTLDFGGSLRAGVTSLITALSTEAGGGILHLAADLRKAKPGSEAEMTQGDAGAAFLIGDAEDAVAVMVGSTSVSVDFVDHFRGAGTETDFTWESRWIRDEGVRPILQGALKTALSRLDIDPASVDRLLVPTAIRGAPPQIAKALGIGAGAVADTLGAQVGDTGTAHPGLMLADALERAVPGETIVLAAFGSGCDVLVLRTTDRIAIVRPERGVRGWLDRRRVEENYLKYLCFRGHLDMDIGIRGEHQEKQPLSALWRRRKTVLGLVGGRCTKSGTIQFPKTEISVNPNDHAVRTQVDHPLAEVPARIMTYTADSLTVSPNPPQYYGNIEFEGGGRMMAEITDVEGWDLDVGQKLRMVFRVKGVDESRNYTRYFWKAVPV